MILHTYYIDRYAGTQSKTKNAMSLDYSLICYIVSRVGWHGMGVSNIIMLPSTVSCYELTRHEIKFCFLIIIR